MGIFIRRYRYVRKLNFDAELKTVFLRATFCIRMKFQTTFLGRYVTTNFMSAHVACTSLLLATIHEKKLNDVLHVWQINQCFRMPHVCQPISRKIGTLINRITLHLISNANSCQMSAKNHSKAFACLLFFILNKGLFKDYANKTRRMHQCHFYSLCGIIIITAMERTKWEPIRKHLKNHEKELSGHDENNFFFYSTLCIFYLTTVF